MFRAHPEEDFWKKYFRWGYIKVICNYVIITCRTKAEKVVSMTTASVNQGFLFQYISVPAFCSAVACSSNDGQNVEEDVDDV